MKNKQKIAITAWRHLHVNFRVPEEWSEDLTAKFIEKFGPRSQINTAEINSYSRENNAVDIQATVKEEQGKDLFDLINNFCKEKRFSIEFDKDSEKFFF